MSSYKKDCTSEMARNQPFGAAKPSLAFGSRYSTNKALKKDDDWPPRQLQFDFQLRREKEVEIQAIQRSLSSEPVSPWQMSFSDSVFQPKDNLHQIHSTRNNYPSFGFDFTQSFDCRDSGMGSETMKHSVDGSTSLPFMASTSFVPRRFSSLQLGEFVSDISCGDHEIILKQSLQDSEKRRMLLLEKVTEAEVTIQSQTEKLVAAEREICYLKEQLNKAAAGELVLQNELDAVKRESDDLKQFKAQTERNTVSLRRRIDKLDEQLKETTRKQSAVLVEAQYQEALLDQTSLALKVLQNENATLQEVNKDRSKEAEMLKSILEQLHGDQQTLQSEADLMLHDKHQLQQEHQKLVLDHETLKSKLIEKQKLHLDIKSRKDRLEQDITLLRMEKETQDGKIDILEDELTNIRENYSNLLVEKEQLLREKLLTEQTLQQANKENVNLVKVNKLLKKESAVIKDAFQKAEELNAALKHEVSILTALFRNNETDTNDKDTEVLHSNKDIGSRRRSVPLEEKESSENQEKLSAEITRLKEKCDKLETSYANEKNEREKLMRNNAELSLQLDKPFGMDQKRNDTDIQEELKNVNEELAKVEEEKNAVVRDLEEYHQKQATWSREKSELQMNQAELDAENRQLKGDLKISQEENKQLKQELDMLRLSTVIDENGNAEDLTDELKVLKEELAKVWDILKVKDSQLEDTTKELKEKQEQLQKLSEDCASAKKHLALMLSTMVERNQMIFTLNDKLLQEQQKNLELKGLQKQQTVEAASLKRQRSKSLGTIDETRSKADAHPIILEQETSDHDEDYKVLMKHTINNLREARDSALKDIQDLREGMKQLTEAFEEEIKVLLVTERETCRKEMELTFEDRLKAKTKDYEFKLEELTNENLRLEMKSKNLECEQEELRNQIEELCSTNSSPSKEKAVQADLPLGRRDGRPLLKRSRSKSTEMTIYTRTGKSTNESSSMEHAVGCYGLRPSLSQRIHST